jgi:hypothetical protein
MRCYKFRQFRFTSPEGWACGRKISGTPKERPARPVNPIWRIVFSFIRLRKSCAATIRVEQRQRLEEQPWNRYQSFLQLSIWEMRQRHLALTAAAERLLRGEKVIVGSMAETRQDHDHQPLKAIRGVHAFLLFRQACHRTFDGGRDMEEAGRCLRGHWRQTVMQEMASYGRQVKRAMIEPCSSSDVHSQGGA